KTVRLATVHFKISRRKGSVSAHGEQTLMPGLALNIIVKNEESNLRRALESVASCVDEIVIVDTGSTDNTVEVARSYGAKVLAFEWSDDFSAARNCAIENTESPWILTLDADEYLLPDDQAKLKKLKQTFSSP